MIRTTVRDRMYISPPHLSGLEKRYVAEAFDSNWVAPAGPHVDAFEQEFCQAIEAKYAAALSSGTAALHLALILAGVQPADEVLVSTLTFSASVNPILYVNAVPVFIDSEPCSWNMDPQLLADAIKQRAARGRLPAAVIVVHLYGQSANLPPIVDLCRRYEIPLIEDAAEALGASCGGRHVGTFGEFGIYSFNGNKIITTSGGGMLVSENCAAIQQARKLATQSRDAAPHFEHSQLGFNYRLSNVLAGIGRGQIGVLQQRVEARRRNFEFYHQHLADLPGIEFMPEAHWGRHTRWLTTLTIDAEAFGADREQIRLALEDQNIEARPVWKPMHRQPVFRGFASLGGHVAEDLFERGLCLPSGSNLSEHDLSRVVDVLRSVSGS